MSDRHGLRFLVLLLLLGAARKPLSLRQNHHAKANNISRPIWALTVTGEQRWHGSFRASAHA